MPDTSLRSQLNALADRTGAVDVDAEWERLRSRIALNRARGHQAAGLGSQATQARSQEAARAGRVSGRHTSKLALRIAASAVAISALAVPLLLRSGALGKPPSSGTGNQSRLAALPPASVPTSFVAYATDGVHRNVLGVFSTTGRLIRTLATDPGLVNADARNGVIVSPDGRSVYYLDRKAPNPTRPEDAVYRVPVARGPSSLVAKGLDPAVSPDGRYLAIQSYETPASRGPLLPILIVVDLRAASRSEYVFNLSGVFRHRMTGEVVVGLAWLAGDGDNLAAVLQCKALTDCSPQNRHPTSSIAVVRISDYSGTVTATGHLIASTPGMFASNLVQPAAKTGAISLIGRHSLRAGERDRVLELKLLPRPVPPVAIGTLPVNCEPLAFDATSGTVLCRDLTGPPDTAEIVRLGHHGPPRVLHLPLGFRVVNAAWVTP